MTFASPPTRSAASRRTIRWSARFACGRPEATPSCGRRAAKRGSGRTASRRKSVPFRSRCPNKRASMICTSRSASGGCRRVSRRPRMCASAASSWWSSNRSRLRRPERPGKSWPRRSLRPTPVRRRTRPAPPAGASAARPAVSGNRSPSCRIGNGCRARIPAAAKRRSATA